MIGFLLIIIYIVIAAALGATAWAVIRTMKIVGKTSGKANGIPVRKINLCVTGIVLAFMILSFVVGSTEPLKINAVKFTDIFWLRTSNMFVFSGVATIIGAAAAMIYSSIIIFRQRQH